MRKHDPHSCVPGNKAHRFIMTESSNYVPVTITRCPNIPRRASRNKRSARFVFTRHVSLALPSPVVRLLHTVSPKQVYEIFETAGSSLLQEIGSRSLNRPLAIKSCESYAVGNLFILISRCKIKKIGDGKKMYIHICPPIRTRCHERITTSFQIPIIHIKAFDPAHLWYFSCSITTQNRRQKKTQLFRYAL